MFSSYILWLSNILIAILNSPLTKYRVWNSCATCHIMERRRKWVEQWFSVPDSHGYSWSTFAAGSGYAFLPSYDDGSEYRGARIKSHKKLLESCLTDDGKLWLTIELVNPSADVEEMKSRGARNLTGLLLSSKGKSISSMYITSVIFGKTIEGERAYHFPIPYEPLMVSIHQSRIFGLN